MKPQLGLLALSSPPGSARLATSLKSRENGSPFTDENWCLRGDATFPGPCSRCAGRGTDLRTQGVLSHPLERGIFHSILLKRGASASPKMRDCEVPAGEGSAWNLLRADCCLLNAWEDPHSGRYKGTKEGGNKGGRCCLPVRHL